METTEATEQGLQVRAKLESVLERIIGNHLAITGLSLIAKGKIPDSEITDALNQARLICAATGALGGLILTAYSHETISGALSSLDFSGTSNTLLTVIKTTANIAIATSIVFGPTVVCGALSYLYPALGPTILLISVIITYNRLFRH